MNLLIKWVSCAGKQTKRAHTSPPQKKPHPPQKKKRCMAEEPFIGNWNWIYINHPSRHSVVQSCSSKQINKYPSKLKKFRLMINKNISLRIYGPSEFTVYSTRGSKKTTSVGHCSPSNMGYSYTNLAQWGHYPRNTLVKSSWIKSSSDNKVKLDQVVKWQYFSLWGLG